MTEGEAFDAIEARNQAQAYFTQINELVTRIHPLLHYLRGNWGVETDNMLNAANAIQSEMNIKFIDLENKAQEADRWFSEQERKKVEAKRHAKIVGKEK